MYLFFDTETTGLPKNNLASPKEVDNWPRIIQLAWVECDANGELLDFYSELIFPENWTIPIESFWVNNGFSQEKSISKGIPIYSALNLFLSKVNAAEMIIAHNIDFDYPVMCAEMIRAGLKSNRVAPLKKFCTMQSSTPICKIPANPGYKYPKLMELHSFLFNEGFIGSHDALNDVMATAKCFFELKNRGLIKL